MEIQIREIQPSKERDPSEMIWKEIKDVWNDPEALIETLKDMRSDNRINLLKEPQQKDLILHVVEQYEEQLKNSEGSLHCFDIDRAFMPMYRDHDGTPDIYDTYALMMRTIIERFPRASHELSDQLDQNSGMVDPKAYIKSLSDIATAPTLGIQEKGVAGHGFLYFLSYVARPEAVVEYLTQQPTEEALAILELLERTMDVGDDTYGDHASREIRHMLHEYVQKDIPVLLRRKIESILKHEHIDLLEKEKSVATIQDRNYARAVILPVSKDYLGVYHREGTVLGLLPRQSHTQYRPKDILRPGNTDLFLEQDPKNEEEAKRKDDAQKSYAMMLEYSFLRTLEQDYGFPVTELTAREQLWFVASLREYDQKEELVVQSFTKKFGLIGARAFLATEFGDEFRETILRIAEKFPEEDARKIFESFSEIVIPSPTNLYDTSFL